MKTLLVQDLNYALKLKKYNHNHDVVISVLDSIHYEYGLRIRDNVPIHYLEFFTDTENFKDPEAPKKAQIEKIINIFRELILSKKVNNVFVGCYAGASRSTALGVVFLVMQGVDATDAFNEIKQSRGFDIVPNLLILRYADEILGFSGENSLVKTIAPLKGVEDTSYIWEGW